MQVAREGKGFAWDTSKFHANRGAGGLGAVSKLRLGNQVDDITKAFNLKSPPSADLIFNSMFLPGWEDRQMPALVIAVK